MKYQVCRPLTPIEFEALKADIAENGVLVPVEVDENGDILDGHHRIRAWEELREEGVKLPKFAKMIRSGLTEEQKRNHARKLNVLRRQMDIDERKAIMEAMRLDGMTLQEVANAVGITPQGVHKALGEKPEINSVEITNTRGQKRPATYASRKPKAAPPVSLFDPGESAGIEPDAAKATVKAERAKRIEGARARKQSAIAETTVAITEGIWHGDMRELGDQIADNSVDLILTDPPYPEEFITLFSELSVFAARALKPGGLCLVYSGQIFLPDVFSRLCTALEYAWTFAIRHSGGNQRIFKVNVNTGWKPVLAFYKPPLNIWWDSFIDVVSGGREKDLHEWQQAESEAAYFIEHLTLPGQVVVDPFCGSGTVLKAAKDLGRQYLGIEMDAEYARRASRRLA